MYRTASPAVKMEQNAQSARFRGVTCHDGPGCAQRFRVLSSARQDHPWLLREGLAVRVIFVGGQLVKEVQDNILGISDEDSLCIFP